MLLHRMHLIHEELKVTLLDCQINKKEGNPMKIRPAVIDDAETILRFIIELAVFEEEPNAVINTVEDIEQRLFGVETHAKALICEENGEPIGFAIYFFNYSTWVGKYGLYLEDVYVTPDYRGSGVGKAIMKHLAQLAINKDCGRFEWVVLHWNQKAIDFYHSIGAEHQSQWLNYRLSGDALTQFAESD